jgi:death-on-curing protein
LPSERVEFLSVDEVLAIHARLIGRFGGPAGLRDAGLLESALYRPRTGHYRDLVEMAAALFESLLMNHPFIDGNKRVAFFATDVFLRLNGFKLAVEAEQAHRHLIGMLERGECDFVRLLPWIRTSLVRIER